MSALHVGSAFSVWESLWSSIEIAKKNKPLDVIKILVPTNHEKKLINRESNSRGLSGISPVIFNDMVEDRLHANNFFKLEPPAFIDRFCLSQALKKLNNTSLNDFLHDESKFSLEELRKAVNRICEYLPSETESLKGESSLIDLTLLWKSIWLESSSKYLPYPIKINIAANSDSFLRGDDSLVAVWGISNLNTAQEDFLRPLKGDFDWYVPGPNPNLSSDASCYLARLNFYLGKKIIDAGSSKTKIKSTRCGDFINCFYTAKYDGYENFSCPEIVHDDLVLLNSLLSFKDDDFLSSRSISSSPTGRALKFHEDFIQNKYIHLNDLIFNLNSLGCFKENQDIHDFDFDLSRYGVSDIRKDLRRLKKAIDAKVEPPIGINVEELKKWIHESQEKILIASDGSSFSRINQSKSKTLISEIKDEKNFHVGDLRFEKDPDDYGRVKTQTVSNMKNGVISPESIAFIGVADNRFPGKLDPPEWQDSQENKFALESIGMPDLQMRIEEESWRAWCIENRGDSGCAVYWDNIDNRGEEQFFSSLFDKKHFNQFESSDVKDVFFPISKSRHKEQVELSYVESVGDVSFKKIWNVGPQDLQISLRASDFSFDKPPCLFAYYVSRQNTLREKRNVDVIYPDSLTKGSFIHHCLETLAKSFRREGQDYELLVQRVMDETSLWYPFTEKLVKKGLFKKWKMFIVEELGRWQNDSFSKSQQEYSGKGKFFMSKIPLVESSYQNLKDVEIRAKIDRIEHYETQTGKTKVKIIDYKTGKKGSTNWTQAFFYPYFLEGDFDFQDFVYRYILEKEQKDVSWMSFKRKEQKEIFILESLSTWKDDFLKGEMVPCWVKDPSKPCYWCQKFGRNKFWRLEK